MHYLITGHTGFKGAWLTVLLNTLGHRVSGLSLDPEPNSLFNLGNLSNLLENDVRQDIRNFNEINKTISTIQPDVVIHMAAQSQVLRSYKNPHETFDINVTGTLNLLEATKNIQTIKAILIVTTDKVYKNSGVLNRYKETDELGGKDPYSASKAMADILTQSWQESCSSPPIGIARAGNVIGGGDNSTDRLIPNLMESIKTGSSLSLRNPDAIRPWQNILDCLNGYLIAIEKIMQNKKNDIWNFGPNENVCRTVAELADFVIETTKSKAKWEKNSINLHEEEKLLLIDSTKARTELNWTEKYNFESSVKRTINWYFKEKNVSSLDFMKNEINHFRSL
jgi:CDP-glucose 4,6-dehydratase